MNPPHLPRQPWRLDLGANPKGHSHTFFRIWAPYHQTLKIKVEGKGIFSMRRDNKGFFSLEIAGVGGGDHYVYLLESGEERPDPVSRFLPVSVHGPTQVYDNNEFAWDDNKWKGIAWKECIFYEIHVGAFTQEGTFQSVIEKLAYLKELGITAIELMPVTATPGRWNWGYDGASLYSVNKNYGGPNGLKQLVNAAHALGIAVCLDVVYNHFGPEGNYLADFGPYFSDAYHTPWGKALNYDGAYSNHVREFVIKNALYWITEFHIDVLRLDATHGIYDFNAIPMLKQLRREVHEHAQVLGREIHVIAESDLNDSRIIRSEVEGGWNFSGVWNDDFHHAAHTLFQKEKNGYYQDFKGLPDLCYAIQHGFIYSGQYSESRKRQHGNSSDEIPAEKFVVFTQNHDQVGNRPEGDRLTAHLSLSLQKIIAALTLMTPSIPLLFMGQEYGESNPFEYFVDFDKSLMEAVYEGRKKEFASKNMAFPGEEAFKRSKLSWDLDRPASLELLEWYQALIRLRKAFPPQHNITGNIVSFYSELEAYLAWKYLTLDNRALIVACCFGNDDVELLTFKSLRVCKENLISSSQQLTKKENSWKIPPQTVAFFLI